MMTEYSQGIAHDGAVILKDGAPMTPEEIVTELQAVTAVPRAWQTTVDFIVQTADERGLADDEPVTIGLWPHDSQGRPRFNGLIRYMVGDFRGISGTREQSHD